jgi:16S rRNA (uracil1498-N3)-methyltransferase
MPLPLFFAASIDAETITLDEDTSRHVTGVLRMAKEDSLLLTDGKGNRVETAIADDHRKKCVVRVVRREAMDQPSSTATIAISLLKNSSRFEWFLEKATELGIRRIIPLICDRTEKEKFRTDRLRQILISAMIQSQQNWLPDMPEPVKFSDLVRSSSSYNSKLIAHCMEGEKRDLSAISEKKEAIVLIGPEGDFTPAELQLALENGYSGISLGHTRLRTETAGMTAAVLLVS